MLFLELNSEIHKTLIERLKERNDLRPAIYSRVSTDKQAKLGYSLERQIDRGLEVINNYGIVPEVDIEIYVDDGFSGTTTSRPDWIRLRNDIKAKKINLIIVVDTDRVGRETFDNEEFKKFLIGNRAEIFFVNDPSLDIYSVYGAFQYTLKSAMGTMEVRQIRLRAEQGIIKSFEKGNYASPRQPYGYNKVKGKLQINEEEAEVVKLIHELYLNKCTSVLQVVEYLRINKVAPHIAWNEDRVKKILKNTVYCDVIFRKDLNRTFTGIAPIIIDADSKEETLKLLNERSRGKASKNSHLFYKMVYCEQCERICVNDTSSKGYKYYLCPVCKNRINEGKMFEQLIELLIIDISKQNKEKSLIHVKEKICDINTRQRTVNILYENTLISKKSWKVELKILKQEKRLLLQNSNPLKKHDIDIFDRSITSQRKNLKKYVSLIIVNMKNKTISRIENNNIKK